MPTLYTHSEIIMLSMLQERKIRKEIFMRPRQFVLLAMILIVLIGLGNSSAYAASLCVHPTGAGRCFTSIQAAVDAAKNGDRIIIRAGDYAEQVTISGKNLTLLGRADAVLQAPEEMQDTLSPLFGFPGRPILLVTDAEVSVRNLTVDGLNSAEANPFLQGIVFLNAGGAIRENLVKNIGFGAPHLPVDENGEPIYQGDAIVVINFLATPRTVRISENRVVNFNNNGILVDAEADFNDPSAANLTVHITSNTIVGAGPNEALDQWGIFIGGFGFASPASSITGTIQGNRVTDIATVGSFPLPSVGLVMFNPYQLEVTQNTLERVQVGMAANQVTGAQIAHNQIVGPGADVFGSSGLLISGTDSVVSENWFRKLDTGILLFVEDPQLGSALNTVVNKNRFNQVAFELMTGPGAPLTAAAADTNAQARVRSPWTKLPHR
jgi:hypothetical protein